MIEKKLIQRVMDDPILRKLSTLAKQKDVPFYLVGGYLRDLLLQRPPPRTGPSGFDYDFTLPKPYTGFLSVLEQALQFHFFKVGKEEAGTLTFRMIRKGVSIDVTLLQGETVEEDLLRRDFTINAIAVSLRDETCHAVEKAFEDIERRVLRAVTPRSIEQDPLRILRAIRYFCTLEGFTLDLELEEEIVRNRAELLRMPSERIKMELDRILLSPQPGLGIRALHELGLLFILFPELKGLEGLGQNGHHHLPVLSHVLLMIDKIAWAEDWLARKGEPLVLTPEKRLCLYYAALFHDLGKQDTLFRDEDGKVHFYHHESFSSKRAEAILERLKFSNESKDLVLRLIQRHMRILNLSQETGESALKRLVNQMGEATPLLVLHTLADKEASRGILSVKNDERVEGHCLRILKLFGRKEILHPPPLITGHDVLEKGVPPGPQVGKVLNFIRQKQIEGEIKSRQEALELLNRYPSIDKSSDNPL
ncbi:MAG: HD domain-containing protein [Desulfobacterota bacterium]|nr:HD domain-containing protein [Thermodesulfobacteriota bacterium]